MFDDLAAWFAELPILAKLALALAGWFFIVVCGILLFALILWIAALPDAWLRIRVRLYRDAPWHRPRHVSGSGGPFNGETARALMARLDPAPPPEPMPPPLPHQYGDAERWIDRQTCQAWIVTCHEVGFNQWNEFEPE